MASLASLLVLAALFAAPGEASAADDDDIVVTGAGWGHGVGLSQYGAYGMALDGRGYQQILTHFYSGAAVGTMGSGGLSNAPPLWVNLEMSRSSMTLRVVNARTVAGQRAVITRDTATGTVSWNAPVGTRITVEGPTNCRLVIERPNVPVITTARGGCAFDMSWDGGAGNPSTAVAVEGCTQAVYTAGGVQHVECRYARGELRIRPRSGTLDLSAVMTMEHYLRGIAEMPYSWGNNAMAALRAQAVAARSYARELQIVRGSPDPTANPDNGCVAWCHVRDTTFDQRYVGWGQEDPRWEQAVTTTHKQVVTHPDAPTGIVRTYYSSSSGGTTENIDEVWGAPARPYYRAVPDPWALVPSVNPYASWTARLGNRAVAAAIGLDTVTDIRVTARHTSGSAATVTFTGLRSGVVTTVTRSSAWMRTEFGLRSIYFSTRLANIRFTDIASSVHAPSIRAIAALGITKGCNPPDNTRYCPGDSVTRGQMAAFLVRALALPATDRDFFTDDNGTTFEQDINRLAASRITLGCNPPANTRFCPGDTVSRGQMAAFLDRAFDYSDQGDADRFTDDDGSIFETNINRIAAAGITLGCNPPANTRYCPDDEVQRGQMASFLYRALTRTG